jgi:hypothetical protein
LTFLFAFSSVGQAQNNSSLSGGDFVKNFTTKDTIFKTPYVDVDDLLIKNCVEGSGEIAGVGNGKPRDVSSFQQPLKN